jgi:hypothetical protein
LYKEPRSDAIRFNSARREGESGMLFAGS